MDKVPNIISTKDFAYLSDMFNWNYTALKQVHHILNLSDNEELNEILEEIFEMHIENCHKIIKLLRQRGESNE